ncbi:MAG: hypothetical protein QXL68_00545 [Desulfurococcaceae archaeon]
MSLTTSWGNNLFNRIIGAFRGPKDPLVKNIHEAMATLDKMTNYIETTKKILENKYEEHQRRAKIFASEGKSEYEKIFIEESKHISSLISLFSKIQYDLIRVKYRLETVTIVEEPLQLIPEIIHELESLKPDIERIAPQLTTLLLEVERRVNSIMSVSNVSSLNSLLTNTSNTSVTGKIPPLPPEEKPSIKNQLIETYVVDINSVKRVLLDEIKRTGGVLVLSDISRKYNIPKHIVHNALKKLEEEGLIKIK